MDCARTTIAFHFETYTVHSDCHIAMFVRDGHKDSHELFSDPVFSSGSCGRADLICHLARYCCDGNSNTYGVSCTKNLSYTMVLDNTGTVTDTATDLIYSLTVPAGTKTGDGLQQVYSITGSMAAGQSGKCATSLASCTNAGTGGNKTRTLTVAY